MYQFLQVFAIFVFATCGGFRGETALLVSCEGVVNKTVTAAFSYPFRLNTAVFSAPDPKGCGGTWTDVCLAGDFSSSAQFFVALAALVFVYCVTALVVYIGYNHVYQHNNKFPLTVFGLLNMILWAGNIWLIYKDTNLHSEKGDRCHLDVKGCETVGSSPPHGHRVPAACLFSLLPRTEQHSKLGPCCADLAACPTTNSWGAVGNLTPGNCLKTVPRASKKAPLLSKS
uniref:Synaptophysin like 1 n=1 Tax=Junco hyemalis TaxID=40217 RepID=A0A8C5J905_JUNHY